MTEWLTHAARGSTILLAALIACAFLGRRSAALRHWLLTMAVACSLALPVLTNVLPSWPGIDLGHLWNDAATLDAEPPQGSTIGAFSIARVAVESGESSQTDGSRAQLDVTVLAVRVWMFGSLVCGLMLLAGLGRLRWLASRAQRVGAGRWLALAAHVQRVYGLTRPVAFLQSDHASLLVTWGWRRPKVLLPATARQWTNDRIRIVLAHELAHIARSDWLAQLAAETLRALYWFNPLVWIVCRRLRIESERACDDAVLAEGIAGSDYAAELLALAKQLHTGRHVMVTAPAMARPSSLEGRIRAMLDRTLNRQPLSWTARLSTLAVFVAISVPLAALQSQSAFYPVTGVVRDSTDRVVPNAQVILTQSENGAKYEVRTDAAGHFAFVGVPAGAYAFQVVMPGFAIVKDSVQITGDTERNLTLHLGSLEETLTVAASNTPPPAPDAATVQRRADSRRRFAERQEQEKTRCAAGGSAATVGGRILQPAKIRDARPVYPETMRAARIGGVVTLDAVIGADGNVREVRNVKGPTPELEKAAADAVRQWQYSVTLLNCEATEVEMSVTVNFNPQM